MENDCNNDTLKMKIPGVKKYSKGKLQTTFIRVSVMGIFRVIQLIRYFWNTLYL